MTSVPYKVILKLMANGSFDVMVWKGREGPVCTLRATGYDFFAHYIQRESG